MSGLFNLVLKSVSLGVDRVSLPLIGVIYPTREYADNTFALHYGGAKTVSGTVTVGGVGVFRKVRLYESSTGVLLMEKWTNTNGTYSFGQLSGLIEFTVTATDASNTYNDVVAARVLAI